MTALAQVVIATGTTETVPGTLSTPFVPPPRTTISPFWLRSSYDLLVLGHLRILNDGVVDTGHAGVFGGQISLHGPNALLRSRTVLRIGGFYANEADTPFTDMINGSGSLLVEGGARVESDFWISMGDLSELGDRAEGRLVIRGNGSTVVTRLLTTFPTAGTNTIDILDGGTLVTANAALFGSQINREETTVATVSGAGSRWDSLDIDVNRSELVVAQGGAINSERITSEFGRLTIGGAIGVAEEGRQSAVAPGVLNVGRILVFDESSLNFNHTSDSYRFDSLFGRSSYSPPWAPAVAELTINVFSGTTILTAVQDDSKLKALMLVKGGTLLVDGFVYGDAFVNTGVFGGAGRISGDIRVNAGGVLSPGNGLGTFQANGNLQFLPGSVFRIDASATDADRMLVGGTATISGARVSVVAQGSGFRPFNDYLILRADGGIDGRFDAVDVDYAFLRGVLLYSPQTVTLRLLRNDVALPAVAITPNQRATAAAVDRLGATNPLWLEILTMDAESARSAFDQLSGDAYPSARTMLFDRAIRVGDTAALASGRTPAVDERGRVWASALAGWGDTSGHGNAGDTSHSGNGVLVGGDASLANWRVGGYFGRGDLRNQIDSRSATTHGQDTHLGAYLVHQRGDWTFSGGVGRSWYELRQQRSVNIGTNRSSLTSTYGADSVVARAEISRGMQMDGTKLEPYLGFGALHVSTDPFIETVGEAALRGDASEDELRYAALGVRVERAFGANDRLHFFGSIEGRRLFGDTSPGTDLAFVSAPNVEYPSQGVPMNRSSVKAEIGLFAALAENVSATAGYTGQFASADRGHAINAALQIRF